MARSLWVFAVLLLLTIAVVTLARRDFSGAWIAYGSADNNNRAVYLTTSDGRTHRQITPFRFCAESPRWSPDGQRLALISFCFGTNNLFHVQPNGLRPQIFRRELPRVLDAQWSPDGQQLVVWSDTLDLYIMEADGSSVRFFAADRAFAQWSPDGEWIYARPVTNGYKDLDRIHIETGFAERLPATPSVARMSWSPDAAQIVISMENALFLMQPDGSALEPISEQGPAPEIREAVWSPDGEWVAFSAGEAVGMHIFRVRANGRDLERLTEQRGNVWHLQWSPDSVWLLFSADYDGKPDIFRLRADGASLQNLTPGPSSDTSPQYAPVSGLDWHPAQTSLVALLILAASVVSSKVWQALD